MINYRPDYCIILEDNLHSQEYFKNWTKKNLPNTETFTFENIASINSWHKLNTKKLANKNVLYFIDINLPDGSSINTIKEVHINPKLNSRIIVISIMNDTKTLFQALRNGAIGYILKQEDPNILEILLSKITQGEYPISPSIAKKIMEYFHPKSSESESNLTKREIETLTLIGKGYTVKEVAQQLNLSPSTVSGYVKIIYQKLHISNRAEATQEAIKLGLI